MFLADSSYGQRLEAMCRDLAGLYYTEKLTPDFEGGNQLEYYEIIDRNIRSLLSHAFFLRGGFDTNVCYNGMAYYTLSDSLI